MNEIEANLARAGSKWKWFRFLQHIGTLGTVVTLLLLAMGLAMDRKWLTSLNEARVIVAIVSFGGFIACVGIIIMLLSKIMGRAWLAQKVEQGQPELQDRLNTLVSLERHKRASHSKLSWFHRRIAAQAASVLKKKPARVSLSARGPIIHNMVFLLVLAGTIFFYDRYDPWRTIYSRAEVQKENKKDEPLELALPDANAVEEKGDWGEMKITEPARDLQITKVDAVQLQIEAAANHTLTNSTWISTVNGQKDQSHPLPAPTEPKYAVYQPVIYADEFYLKDWDVMTYYAQARTEHGKTYGSEVYFLEVRPFREDILKMTGGEGSSAYRVLSQLTDLINRQQHVIRQTHHFTQNPPATEKLQDQDRQKLADAENDLSEAAQHLYAEIAVKMENKPIGAVLDQLGLAGKTLLEASGSLGENKMVPAQEQERLALRQLIETRKIFQKTVSDHPDDFKPNPAEDENSPAADDSKDKLKEMAEFRDEEKATREFVDKLLQKQQALSDEAAKSKTRMQTNLASQQGDLKKELDQFSGQHPQIFKHATNELAQASSAMDKSAQALNRRANGTREEPNVATQKVQELVTAVAEETVGRQLTSAYKLKKILDQQITNLERVEKTPGDASQDELQKTSSQTRETTAQLKQLTSQKPTADFFGPKLAESLKDDTKKALDQELEELGNSTDPGARQELASKVKQELQNVSKAFEQSQPQALQASRGRDSLKDGEQTSFEKGMAQLQSLVSRMQNNHPLSTEDQLKLQQEALRNLRNAMQESRGNESAKQLLLLVEEEFKEDGHKIDLAGLKKLMAELEHFSAEIKDPLQKTNDPTVTSVDPSRLPPAYRGRIEKYFRKLSEAK